MRASPSPSGGHLGRLLTTLLLLTFHLSSPAAAAATVHKVKQCQVPAPGQPFETATPAQVAMKQAGVNRAIAYADSHNRISVQIFRYNCLIARGLEDPVTDSVPNNVWSVTKSVVSLLTGIAIAQGKLSVDDHIGKYLPHAPGWGNKTHRALTVNQLLTETAGFDEAIFAEAGTTGLDESAPQEALAQPFQYAPGTTFSYSQRVPDLLAYVVGRAVGMDIQDFAQQYLFGPIGVAQDSYFWLRDRSGDTYGYAWLFIPPTQLARLGLLLQGGGVWNGTEVISPSYIKAMTTGSPHNTCYGYLFWLNSGKPCTGANVPDAQTYHRYAVPGAPRDMFMAIGALQQNIFVIPSLGITVVWTGFFGDDELNLAALLSASAADLYDNFFVLLLAGVENQKVPDPGFFKMDPLDLDVNPLNYLSPFVLATDLLPNKHCNFVYCRGGVPSKGLYENFQDIAQLILGKLV